MKNKIIDTFKNFKNPIIFMATATNIWILLETIDVLNFCGVTRENYMKIVGIVMFLLIQFGVLTKPKNPINIPTSSNEIDNLDMKNNNKYE